AAFPRGIGMWRETVARSPSAPGEQRCDRLAEQSLGITEPLELSVADPGRRELGGKPLELRPDLVCLADIACAHPAYERAPPRLNLHEPGCLQLAERLSDARP